MPKKPSLTDLKPDDRNANRGTERGRAALEDSLRTLGAGRSIVVDRKGRILAGNKTHEVAVELGLGAKYVDVDGNTLVVVRRTDLDLTRDSRARQLAYADNRVGELNLDWDLDVLKSDVGAGIDPFGWSPAELARFKDTNPVAGLTEPDNVPPAEPDPRIEPGRVYAFGSHRLICGDSTNPDILAKLFEGTGGADAILTDPPYGTASETKVQRQKGVMKPFKIDWDKEAPSNWTAVVAEWLNAGGAMIAFGDNKRTTEIWASVDAAGLRPLQHVYWRKNNPPPTPRPNFCSAVETAVFARKPGAVRCWNGGGSTPNVFDAALTAGNERTAHETQKPISLWTPLLSLITNPGMLVFDPFVGSGTTLIAAQQTGRTCYAVEIDPSYCDIAIRRWEAFTGQTVKR